MLPPSRSRTAGRESRRGPDGQPQQPAIAVDGTMASCEPKWLPFWWWCGGRTLRATLQRISTIPCGTLHALDPRGTSIREPIGSPGARLARGAIGLAWGTKGEGPMGYTGLPPHPRGPRSHVNRESPVFLRGPHGQPPPRAPAGGARTREQMRIRCRANKRMNTFKAK